MTIERSTEPEAFTAFERGGWAATIRGYERALGRVTEKTVAATLDAAGVAAGRRVLDLCTGHGILAAGAKARGAEAQGLDFAPEVLETARRNVPGVVFDQGDAQNLPYPDRSFDIVLCGYGLMHLSAPDRALREMYRVLKPGGRVAVSVWQRAGLDNGLGLVFGAIKAHGRLDVPLPHGPDFFQFGDSESLTAALVETGFVNVAAKPFAQDWRVARPGELIDGFLQGTVRAKALLEAQDVAALAAITSAITSGMARFAQAGGGYAVPMPALIGSGTRP